MDGTKENVKDLELLELRSLKPLEAECVAGAHELAGMIANHNRRIARAGVRLRQLADDRRRLLDFESWLNADGVDIAGLRCLVRRDSWDALLALHRLLTEREALLGLMQAQLEKAQQRAGDDYTRAVAHAERKLSVERRELQFTNPGTASSHFGDLVAHEPEVLQTAARMTDLRSALETTMSARRQLLADWAALTKRRREVFATTLLN